MLEKNDGFVSHYGILGMRWGRRKSSKISPSDRNFEKKKALLMRAIKRGKIKRIPELKKMSDRDIAKVMNDPVMNKKMKEFRKKEVKETLVRAAFLTAATYYGLSINGVNFKAGARKIVKFVADKNAERLSNKFGGFDPAKVVTGRFV